MFDDLIEKLKAQVEALRKKLPGGGDDDEYEDDEDDYEEKYHGDEDEDMDDGKTVQVQVKDLMDDSEEDEEDGPASTKEKTQKIYADDEDDEYDDDEEEDEDDEAAAQKKKKMLIYGGAAVLILALVAPEFMPKDEMELPEVQQIKPKKKKRRKKRKKPKAPPKAVEQPAEKAPAPAPAPVEEPKVADIPPETAAGIAPKVVEEPAPAPEPEVRAVVETPEPPAPEPEPAPVVPTPEPTVPKAAMGEDNSLDISLGEEPTGDLTAQPSQEKKAIEDMSSKIEKKVEYVAPPNYERSGRGLVYNCVGKHWACVDKFSYLTCNENTKWSKQNGKKPECHIKNVYATVDDCHRIQKHYIEISEPTAFCQNMDASVPSGETSTSADSAVDSQAADEIDLLE